MRERTPADVRVTEGAGHLSLKHLPRPETVEPQPNTQAFLDDFAKDVLASGVDRENQNPFDHITLAECDGLLRRRFSVARSLRLAVGGQSQRR
jgi:hypothetical protein